jgi:hypothetical protein
MFRYPAPQPGAPAHALTATVTTPLPPPRAELEAAPLDVDAPPLEGIPPLPPPVLSAGPSAAALPAQLSSGSLMGDAAPGSHAGSVVRARLERIWQVLEMPPPARLDMVLAFTSRDRARMFGGSLALWEQAAAAVLAREAQVEALVGVQGQVAAGNADRLSLSALQSMSLRLLGISRYLAGLAERLQGDTGWALTFRGAAYPGSNAVRSSHLLALLLQIGAATKETGLRP